MQLAIFVDQFVCTDLTDPRTRFCRKLIYMYVIRWCLSEIVEFLKLLLVVANLSKLRFLAVLIKFFYILVYHLVMHYYNLNVSLFTINLQLSIV